MPIGKNSIKRVKDGYSNVSTAAPDMENSTVLANPAPEVIELVTPKAKTATPQKRGRKPGSKNVHKASANSTAKSAPKKPAAKNPATNKPIEKSALKDGFERFALGDDMPVHLL